MLMTVEPFLDRPLYRMVVDRQTSLWNYPSQLSSFAQAVRSRLYNLSLWGGVGQVAPPTDSPYGSVFNLEFSPVEDVAVAVCANRAILVYDPRNGSRIHVVPHAHEDAVNCITFLDSFAFATCSDDKSIRLWDLRKLSTSTAMLKGHKNWVKNIEYDCRSGLLFSIAFFDGVRCWDLNHLELYADGERDNLVLPIRDSVRMRLSESRMFVSTRKNKCLVVENFKADSLWDISHLVGPLLSSKLNTKLLQELYARTTNQPSVHTMSGLVSGLDGNDSFRAVMSTTLHPSGNFIALRHLDIKNDILQYELTSLYDLRDSANQYLHLRRIEHTQHSYLQYIDESSPMEALDYIKEIAFSRDGRVLASPFDKGARLLAVDRKCTPVDVYYDQRFHSTEKAAKYSDLEVVALCDEHKHPVLTCQFARKDMLLATGCLGGTVLFHKPRL